MTTDQFDDLVRDTIAGKRAWFEGAEPPANADDLAKVEAKLGHALPEQYEHFALTFGGGYFGGVNISTLSEKSSWYVLARPSIKINDSSMLVISDDEAGGYYGFLLNADGFESSVTYVSPDDGNSIEEAAPTFFDFVEKFALNT